MFDLPTLLPPNAQQVEYDLEQLSARLQGMAQTVHGLWDIDECPRALLPWLAWGLSVDEWDSTWTEGLAREVIRQSTGIHRQKGTVGAVRAALQARGFVADINEWHRSGGDPFTFSLDAFLPTPLTDFGGNQQSALQEISRLIEATKPVRAHLGSVRLGYAQRQPVGIGSIGIAALRFRGVARGLRSATRCGLRLGKTNAAFGAIALRGQTRIRRPEIRAIHETAKILTGGVVAVRLSGTAVAERFA